MIDFQTDPSRYRHWRLAFDGPKRAEVVFADQHLRGRVHAFGIERAALPGGAPESQRRTRFTVEYEISIAACHGAIARVEMPRHFAYPGNAHIVG